MNTVIRFENVSKLFALDNQRPSSFQETLVNAFHRRRDKSGESFWALRGVSFAVRAGESLALIGANGSGKSTALKLISRIILPTSGEVSVQGRVAALLELGAGFHPDLTGRENVSLNGSILGLSRSFIRRQMDEIVAFSELQRFIDTPVRNYSSGMLMRLGFSVATAFQPDILIIDEVLAVGDQAFQDRCLRRIRDIQENGATVILVSHDLESVRRLCQRAIWLDEGRARADGPTAEVASQYLEELWTLEQDKIAAEKAEDTDPVEVIESEEGSGRRWRAGRSGQGARSRRSMGFRRDPHRESRDPGRWRDSDGCLPLRRQIHRAHVVPLAPLDRSASVWDLALRRAGLSHQWPEHRLGRRADCACPRPRLCGLHRGCLAAAARPL